MDNTGREHIEVNTLGLLYSRYKAFIVPFLVIIVVIIVFIKFNVPAISDLLKGYEEQKSTKQTLESMRNNLNLLNSINASNLDSQFDVVIKALPINKDFESILNAISDASNSSGVALGPFRFTVGSLSKEETVSDNPALNLKIGLVGDVNAVNKFMEKLTKTLPLSQVIEISAQKDVSALAIDFYYRPVETAKTNDNLPIGQISSKGMSLINELSTFSFPKTSSFDSSQLPVSTPSANPFF